MELLQNNKQKREKTHPVYMHALEKSEKLESFNT